MIRVYSANFTKQDFEDIATILSIGLAHVAPLENCKLLACSKCEKRRVCRAVTHAIENMDGRGK